jgi:hypothetical protein
MPAALVLNAERQIFYDLLIMLKIKASVGAGKKESFLFSVGFRSEQQAKRLR